MLFAKGGQGKKELCFSESSKKKGDKTETTRLSRSKEVQNTKVL